MDFIQARNYRKGRRGQIGLVVIHDMESPEEPNTAEAVAQWFAGKTAPKASAHFCITPETRVLTGDLRWVLAGDLVPGDRLVAVDEFHRNARGRRYQSAEVEVATRRVAPCLTITLEDGRKVTSSTDHWWLTQLGGAKWEWVATDALKVGDMFCVPLTPWNAVCDEGLSWLAGLLDGEGSLHRNGFEMTFSQAEGPVMGRALEVLDTHGLPYRIVWRSPAQAHHKKVGVVNISGVQGNLELLGRSRPVRFIERAAELLDGRFLGSRTYSGRLAIAAVESAGEREVVSLRTSARTFLAEGIVSHNCVDTNSVVQCVKLADEAWHAPPVNPTSIGVEHAGRASQRRDQWLDPYSLAELQLSVALVRDLLLTHQLPLEWVDAAGLKAGRKGVTTHWEVTKAFGVSDHTDPGSNFPLDVYLAMVRAEIPKRAPDKEVPVANAPFVALLVHPSGGYLQIGSDGGVFAWNDNDDPGDEQPFFYGSMGGVKLNAPVVDACWTPTSAGYWMVAADGGVFTFGDAVFHGGMGGQALNKPIVSVAGVPEGGYILGGEDGGVFPFGPGTEHLGNALYSG